jgi:hypothetical protein
MKRRVREFLICALVIAFFSMRVMAGNCGGDLNQKLFGISSQTNAHGEIWSGTNYSVDICFDDYFNDSYQGSQAHTCVANNVTLRLSGSANAHAETNKELTAGYTNVCYQGLQCFNTTRQCNDTSVGGGADYSIIVFLSGKTNAHISLTNIYGWNICCKAPGYEPLCDYDGNCEESSGETPQNCPDCFAVCGDGNAEGSEECDGGDLRNMECGNFEGYVSGDGLACYPHGGENECRFNLTGCEPEGEAVCGDGDREGDEECDCGPEWNCDPEELDDETCDSLGWSEGEGGLSCNQDDCSFDYDGCEEQVGFCATNAPFLFEDESGALMSPSSCQDYNLVYNSSDEITERMNLCKNNCVPGASEPVNNGYSGNPPMESGCGWDAVHNECYFYFNVSGNDQCRVDYNIIGDCGPDTPFRTVNVTSYPISGEPVCDACGNGESSCITQILCPRVIELPLIGAFGAILAVVIIVLVYIYLKKKK